MKNLLKISLLFLFILFICSCAPGVAEDAPEDNTASAPEEKGNSDTVNKAEGNADIATEEEGDGKPEPNERAAVPPENNGDRFIMTATVLDIGDKIEVEVLESEYASGIYLVITSDETVFLNECGTPIGRGELKAGDTVRIVYGGQVMLSLPPQIIATEIVKIN